MVKLKIDPEFRDKIPPLTDAEFEQLQENILNDGEVYEPIAVWNGTIVDGHNRYKIVQEHPEIPFRVKEMNFPDKWAAFDWMYKKQLGRRNLTDEQRTVLIGKMYEARKKTVGAPVGNKNAEKQCTQNGNIESTPQRISDQIAQELGVAKNTVIRAERFSKGVDAIREQDPEAAEKILQGRAGVTKGVIQEVPQMEPEDVKRLADAIVKGERTRPDVVRYTKKDRQNRKEIEAIVADMYDPSTVPEFTLEFLIEDIQANGKSYIELLRNTLKDRSNLLTDENRPAIAEAISSIIAEITKIKELVVT